MAAVLRGFARAHDFLVFALAVLAAAIAAGLVLLICTDVALRNLRLGNVPWSLEVSEYGLYAMTLLGAPWVLSMGAHVRMDLVADNLPGAVQRWLEPAVSLLGAAICGTIFWYGLVVTQAAAARGSLIFKTLVFPEWWFLVLVPFCFALLTLGFLRRALEAALLPATGAPARSKGSH